MAMSDEWQPVERENRTVVDLPDVDVGPEDLPDWLTDGGKTSLRVRLHQKQTSRGTRNTQSIAYRFLKEHGPTPSSELEDPVTRTDKQRRGVRRISGPRNYVWYIEDEHDPHDVVRTFLEANPNLQEKHKQALAQRFSSHSDELREAVDEVAPEFGIHGLSNTGGGSNGSPACPICGEEVAAIMLPDHIGTHGENDGD